jgi:hypothetical protein
MPSSLFLASCVLRPVNDPLRLRTHFSYNYNALLAPTLPSGTPLELGVHWRRLGSRLLLGGAGMGPGHLQNGGRRQERHLDATEGCG